MTEAELKKIQDEAEEEKKKDHDSDSDDEDPQSKKEIDERILSRVDDLGKEADKISKEHKSRNEKLLTEFEKGKKNI